MFYLIGIIVFFTGVFVGYWYCMLRWRPRVLLEMAKIQSQLIKGEISGEEAVAKFRELEKKSV